MGVKKGLTFFIFFVVFPFSLKDSSSIGSFSSHGRTERPQFNHFFCLAACGSIFSEELLASRTASFFSGASPKIGNSPRIAGALMTLHNCKKCKEEIHIRTFDFLKKDFRIIQMLT